MELSNVYKYGVPEQKKFPLPDADHVRSAIKFFNYVQPKYEKELARAILRKAKEYNVDLSEISIGENNRFKKYLPNELKHHGILGQKWGIRRFQNEDGTLTSAGKERYNYGNKEGLITKNKRLLSADAEKKRIDSLQGKERANAVSKYRRKYGFSYQNAKIFGVREANRIGKYAYKKKLSEQKATGKYLLKKVGTSLALTAGAYGAAYYLHTHPEQAVNMMFAGQRATEQILGKMKIGADELRVRMDPNIVDGRYRATKILDNVGYLPYSTFSKK